MPDTVLGVRKIGRRKQSKFPSFRDLTVEGDCKYTDK